MFYDEQGKHVRTKKEILDENGEVRKGCKIVKKGEVYERNLFTSKDRLFKQDGFVDEVKHFYTAIAALVLLVSKVMKKAVELSEKILHIEPKPVPEMPQKILEQILPRPVMSADAAAYPELHKICNELSNQNGIIFNAERERNAIQEEINNLKGIAKVTKKKELQGKLDRANERVDLLKKRLLGIVKRTKE